MKLIDIYKLLKQKSLKNLSEGNFKEYIQTLIIIENIETRLNKLSLLN